MRLTKKLTTMIAKPGNTTVQGAVSMKLRVSAIIKPHSAAGGCTPRPKKLSVAPSCRSRTKSLMAKTNAGASTFGRIWRSMVRKCPYPRLLGGQDIFAPPNGHRFAPHDPGIEDPAHGADRDVEVHEPRPQHRDDRDDKHQERESDDNIDHAAYDRIGQATEVSGYQPDERADHERDRDADEPDLEIDAGGVDDPGENVAPELVSAEGMCRARRLKHGEEIELHRIIRCQKGRAEGRDDEEREADEPKAH